MNSKIVVAGFIWLILALFSLLGLLGMLIMSVTEPTLFSYWYISLLSIPFSFIFLILFFVLSIGLLLEKKWSFKLGIVVPILDIIISGIFSVFILTVPNLVPKIIEADLGVGIAGTVTIAVIEIFALVLVLKSKNELVN